MWESCGRGDLSWCWSSRWVSLRQGCGQSSCGAGFWGTHHHGECVESSPEVSGCRDGSASAVAQQQLLPFLGLSQGWVGGTSIDFRHLCQLVEHSKDWGGGGRSLAVKTAGVYSGVEGFQGILLSFPRRGGHVKGSFSALRCAKPGDSVMQVRHLLWLPTWPFSVLCASELLQLLYCTVEFSWSYFHLYIAVPSVFLLFLWGHEHWDLLVCHLPDII